MELFNQVMNDTASSWRNANRYIVLQDLIPTTSVQTATESIYHDDWKKHEERCPAYIEPSGANSTAGKLYVALHAGVCVVRCSLVS